MFFFFYCLTKDIHFPTHLLRFEILSIQFTYNLAIERVNKNTKNIKTQFLRLLGISLSFLSTIILPLFTTPIIIDLTRIYWKRNLTLGEHVSVSIYLFIRQHFSCFVEQFQYWTLITSQNIFSKIWCLIEKERVILTSIRKVLASLESYGGVLKKVWKHLAELKKNITIAWYYYIIDSFFSKTCLTSYNRGWMIFRGFF